MRWDFFLHVMVGGDGGVVGPKELVGWVDTVTDNRSYTPPTPSRCFLKEQSVHGHENLLYLSRSVRPAVCDCAVVAEARDH